MQRHTAGEQHSHDSQTLRVGIFFLSGHGQLFHRLLDILVDTLAQKEDLFDPCCRLDVSLICGLSVPRYCFFAVQGDVLPEFVHLT
jgi:hypothetical protein